MNHRSRRIHRAFAFLLAAFVAAGVSFSYPSASAQISAAKELISQQRFAEAQAILERLLNIGVFQKVDRLQPICPRLPARLDTNLAGTEFAANPLGHSPADRHACTDKEELR